MAYEQKINISNSIDADYLKSEEEKYSQIIDNIFYDILNNGIYFTIDNTQISPSEGKFYYNIIGAKAYLKRDVFDRNVKKAEQFTHRSIFQNTYGKSKFQYFLFSNPSYSKICMNYMLVDEYDKIIDGDRIRKTEILLLEDFLDKKHLKYNRVDWREKILRGSQDILLMNNDFKHILSYEEIARIKDINFKATECPDRE